MSPDDGQMNDIVIENIPKPTGEGCLDMIAVPVIALILAVILICL